MKPVLQTLKITGLHILIGPFIGLNTMLLATAIMTILKRNSLGALGSMEHIISNYGEWVVLAYAFGGIFALLTGLILGIIYSKKGEYSYLIAVSVTLAVAMLIPLIDIGFPFLKYVGSLEDQIFLIIVPSVSATLGVKALRDLWAKRTSVKSGRAV